MSYILIQNDGEIEIGAFELIGASTKRNQTGKIGFFGSGLKYSIAFMMRNNIDFKIFSGLNEIKFTPKSEQFRDQTFDRICINGVPTSYTTTMGPTWKKQWFVLREIYCNALDEPGCQIIKETENVNPSEGKTRIYIQLTDDLKKILNNWDAYFSADREPLYVKEKVYTSALGNDDIKGCLRQTVKVYPKSDGVIFRRGVRVHASKSYLFDYEFESVNINEDRTASKTFCMDYVIANLMSSFINTNYVATVLRSFDEDVAPMELSAIKSTKPEDKYSTAWITFSKTFLLVVKEKSGNYAEQVSLSKREVFLIPSHFAKLIKKDLPEVEILGMDRQVDDIGFSTVERTPKMNYLLTDVIKNLKEVNYSINYDIEIVSFDNDTVLGKADTANKLIYLSEKVFDMGRREIALTLMEENEYIHTGYGDESRAFQSHLLSSWLKEKENVNGLFF